MSAWDSYITNMQASGLHVAGIFGQEGGVWAVSPKMNASQQEILSLVQAIKSENFANGVVLGGKKCTMIRCSPDSVTAKCRNADSEDEKFLIHIALAKTCVVVGGICGPNERDSTSLTENIRDYLAKSGY